MGSLFPATLTWATVQTGITELLSNDIVLGAIVFVLALVVAPLVIRSLRRMVMTH